jgi:hypothetical protein
MAIEHASVQVVHKPWGVADLRPWSSSDGSGEAIGELWFQRADKNAPIPALLLKLLFTSEPLSTRSIRMMPSRVRQVYRTVRPRRGTSSRHRRTRGLPLD